jgi:hypothetical protein
MLVQHCRSSTPLKHHPMGPTHPHLPPLDRSAVLGLKETKKKDASSRVDVCGLVECIPHLWPITCWMWLLCTHTCLPVPRLRVNLVHLSRVGENCNTHFPLFFVQGLKSAFSGRARYKGTPRALPQVTLSLMVVY